MKVTIRDVADAAGVSAMAVSAVLHGSGRNVRVNAKTADKIREIARELRYQPNTLARSFRSQKTSQIGVVFQHFDRLSEDNPYYPQLLNGVMAALFAENYTLSLCPKLVRGDDSNAIWDGRFDGVVWARPDFTEASVERLRNSTTPLVMVHAPPGSAEGVSSFSADNEGALRIAVDHLVGLGHRNLTFVVDQINEHTADGKSRADAFRKACESREVPGNTWVWDQSTEALALYRIAHPKITGMVVYSDTLAGRLLVACEKAGIAIPKELSVVGFDSSSFCDRTKPKLTSIIHPVEKIANEATSYLIKIIQTKEQGLDPLPPVSTLYECGLDIRESTSSPSNESPTHRAQPKKGDRA